MTIIFKHASLVVDVNSEIDEIDGEEAYIEVSVNGTKQEPPTTPLEKCTQCDFNYVFESDLIDKNTKISFAVWDKDLGQENFIDSDEKLIAREDTERTVIHYLGTGAFIFKNLQSPNNNLCNYMETVSFWTDEYKKKPIDDRFLRPAMTSNRGPSNRQYG